MTPIAARTSRPLRHSLFPPLLLLSVWICWGTGSLFAQSPSRPENSGRSEPSTTRSEPVRPFVQIMFSLRRVYMEASDDIRRLRLYRSEETEQDQVTRLRNSLRALQRNRLSDVRTALREVVPSSETHRRRLEKLRSAFELLRELLEKTIDDWTPSDEQRRAADAYPPSQLLRKGLAGPELLRKKFLQELMAFVEQIYIRRLQRPFPSLVELRQYRTKISDYYDRLFPKFLSLRSKLDSLSSESSSSNLKKIYRTWRQHLKNQHEQRRAIQQGLMQLSALFENRIDRSERQDEIHRRIQHVRQRFYNSLRRMDDRSIFRDGASYEWLLRRMGRHYVGVMNRLIKNNLSDVHTFYDTFNKALLSSANAASSGKDTYEKRKSVLRNMLRKLRRRHRVRRVTSAFQQVPLDLVKSISRNLLDQDEERSRKLGRMLRDYQQSSVKVRNWMKRAIDYTRTSLKRFRQLNYDPETFEKRLLDDLQHRALNLYKDHKYIQKRMKDVRKKRKKYVRRGRNTAD